MQLLKLHVHHLGAIGPMIGRSLIFPGGLPVHVHHLWSVPHAAGGGGLPVATAAY